MNISLMVFLIALLVWLVLITVGSLARLCLHLLTMRKETSLQEVQMVSGLSGQQLFDSINREYGGIFRLDYTADEYGKVMPTLAMSRLSFSFDMLRRLDYGTVFVPRVCDKDRSLLAAALISHEVGHLILLANHSLALALAMCQQLIVTTSAVISTFCVAGSIVFRVFGLGEWTWMLVLVGLIVAISWGIICITEWAATKAGLRAAKSSRALVDEEVLTCKEICRLWYLTYFCKFFIHTIPLVIMVIVGSL